MPSVETSPMDYTDFHQLVLKELECPVCFEYMRPPITVCQSGHNICYFCKPNMHSCPTCRQEFLQTRSLSLESLAQHVMFPCTNRRTGCPEVLGLDLISQHQEVCSFASYKCPFAKISNACCTHYSTLDVLKIHFLKDHKESTLKIYGGGKFYSHLSPLTNTANMSKALLVFGEIFYVVWKVIEGEFYCTVMYVGPRNISSQYGFRFALTAKNKVETISACMITKSYFENIDQVLRPGNCIAVHYNTIETFFADENKLPFQLEIFKLNSSNPGETHAEEQGFNNDGNESQ